MNKASKFWYEVESFSQGLSSQIEKIYTGKDGKAKARRYAKQISAMQTETDFVINGYDISETWRNGKRI